MVVSDYPRGGLGTWLIDREVIDDVIRHPARNTDIGTRLFTMGYTRQLHPYHREEPKMKSNWTFRKNIKLVIDNFIGFSYLPVRLMSLAGVVTALAGFCFAGYVFLGKVFPDWYTINQPPGWATIVVLLMFTAGMLMLMLMLGVIGEYLWRILDCVRGEPMYRVEEASDGDVLPKKAEFDDKV